jgi:hypothetical protein
MNTIFQCFVKDYKKLRAKKDMEGIKDLIATIKYTDSEEIKKRENGWLWILKDYPIWFFFNSLRCCFDDIEPLFYKWVYNKSRNNTIFLLQQAYNKLSDGNSFIFDNFAYSNNRLVYLNNALYVFNCKEEMICYDGPIGCGMKIMYMGSDILKIHQMKKCF